MTRSPENRPKPVGSAGCARFSMASDVDRNVKAKARLGLAIVAFAAIYGVIALRLVMFAEQSDGHGARRSVGQDAVATARPDILDRNGEILATDVKAPSLFAEPRKLIDVDEAEELLTAVLPDLDANEVRERLSSKRGFVWLKREITPKQQQEIHRLGIPGVGFLTENKRVYPERPGGLARDRPRQHRQPGHRRHREMAGRAGARRAAHGGACHRPAAEAGQARARSARAVRVARRARGRAREIQGQGCRPASSSTSTPAKSSPWCRCPTTTRTIRARPTTRPASTASPPASTRWARPSRCSPWRWRSTPAR